VTAPTAVALREHRVELGSGFALITEVMGERDQKGNWTWKVQRGWTELRGSRQPLDWRLLGWIRSDPSVVRGLPEAMREWEHWPESSRMVTVD
jgi:hypothetical protein